MFHILESIYATVAALDVARVVIETREFAIEPPALVPRFRTVLRGRTDSFQGFAEASGRSVSETFAHRLHVSNIPERLAEMASSNWKEKSRDAIEEGCRSFLMREFTFVARAK